MDMWFIWLARLMYLGIFLMAGGMFFRAWKIGLRRDLRYVTDWRGRTMPHSERLAPAVFSVNFVGGSLLLSVAIAVLMVGLSFTIWTGISGLVLWSYYFFLRVLMGRAERADAL